MKHDNPIRCDDREGSSQLGALLRRRKQPVDMCRLPYGDISFLGQGPEGRPLFVGIEYKTVGDVLKCITDGRFAGVQLPGLVANYESVILLLEGRTRPEKSSGVLQIQSDRGFWYDAHIGTRRFTYSELDHWCMTLQFKAGVHVLRTGTIDESAAAVIDAYSWWTGKGWDGHQSHLALPNFNDQVNIVHPKLVRRVARELPGVGWTRSAAVARRFPTVLEMALAGEDDWRGIDGIGVKTAAQIVAAIQNGGS